MWGLKSASHSPASQTPTSHTVTPAVDPSPTVTPTSPRLFAEIKVINESSQYAMETMTSTQTFYPVQAFIHHSIRIQSYLKHRKALRHRKFVRLPKNEDQKKHDRYIRYLKLKTQPN